MIARLKQLFRRRATAAEWQQQFGDLKRSLAALPADNSLWPGLLALLDQYTAAENDALAQPGISDAELRRAAGRIGMLADLRKDLEELPAKAREEQKK